MSHERLDLYVVARNALALGHELVRTLPRGYGHFGDQVKRALLSAFLGAAESLNRSGADRSMRSRIARAEAAEAAAAIDGLLVLHIVDAEQGAEVRELLERVYAMLTKLGRLGG